MRKKKKLWSKNGKGTPITFVRYPSDMDEAAGIVSSIKSYMYKEPGAAFNDNAILYRTNAQSRAFEDVLMREQIPYKVVGGQKFYERNEKK